MKRSTAVSSFSSPSTRSSLSLAALGAAAAAAGVGFMLSQRSRSGERRRQHARARKRKASLSPLRSTEPSHRPLRPGCSGTLAAAAGLGWLLQRAWKPKGGSKHRAAQALGAGAAIVCLSVALDSALEHYRGEFKDRLMFVGPTMAILGLGAATYIAFKPESAQDDKWPRIALVTVGATGLIGVGFHSLQYSQASGRTGASKPVPRQPLRRSCGTHPCRPLRGNCGRTPWKRQLCATQSFQNTPRLSLPFR